MLGTSVITATSHLFIRQNIPLPPTEFVADRDGWTVRIEGVARPGDLSVASLKRLGVETIATVLQCSGNGRKFFEHGPSGSPWTVGGAGCVIWSGVPLRRVVDHLGGVLPGARYLTTRGGEPLPNDVNETDVVVERSVPIEKALDDCLLVWEMNGEPLPLSHGGPLRLVVPGYYGCNQIKFVRRVAFTEAQSSAKIQQTGYRMRPIGEHGSPDQPSLWEMPVKSFVTSPTARTPLEAGRVLVTGVAFGGMHAVSKVEISTDGTTWRRAELIGPDLGPYAWRLFRIELDAEASALPIFSRATNARGEVQPEARAENAHGYGNNSWRDMGVVVRVCAPGDTACLTPDDEPGRRRRGPRGPVQLSERAERGRAIFNERAQPSCSTCHALEHAHATGAVGPDLDGLGPTLEQVKAAVQNGIGAMPSFGQSLTPEQVEDVAAYVFEVTR